MAIAQSAQIVTRYARETSNSEGCEPRAANENGLILAYFCFVTGEQQIRNPLLYPTELWARACYCCFALPELLPLSFQIKSAVVSSPRQA